MFNKKNKITKEKLLNWRAAKDALEQAKANELKLRDEICSYIIEKNDKPVGASHLKDFGMDATATGVLNMKVDTDTLEKIYDKLSKEEKNCIKFKPELVTGKYKGLSDKSQLHKAVTVYPGQPQLKIKDIKEA